MSKIKSILVFLLIAAAALLCAASLGQQPAVERRPNILLAIADDWGWPHAGAYGDAVVQTPTFDRVAREGIRFNHAYVSSPSCTPSRAALLTGQWHWRLRESANLHSTLRNTIPVYPDLLEAAGYFVGYTRKGWGPGRFEVGGRNRNPAGAQFETFADFIDQRPADQPFCFWFGSTDPHRVYTPGSGEASGIDLDAVELPAFFPESRIIRSDMADYYWEVQRFDREVGEILSELERRAELENTIIVITADNGMPFPRAKGNLYDAGTRVPLAMRWAGRIRAGGVIDDFVSLTDLAPTFLEAAGLEPPEVMTGKSLVNIFQSGGSGRIDPDRNHMLTGKERHVPCQEGLNGGGTPMRAIRTHDFLYIRNFKPDRWPAGTPHYSRAFFENSWYGDIDNGPTKYYMYEHRRDPEVEKLFRLAFAKRPAEELYDLSKDPHQLNNVADRPEYAERKTQLAKQLMEESKASSDPRAFGAGDEFDYYPYYGGSPRKPEFMK